MAGQQHPERRRQRAEPEVELRQPGKVILRIRDNAEERDHVKQRTQHHDRHQHDVQHDQSDQTSCDAF